MKRVVPQTPYLYEIDMIQRIIPILVILLSQVVCTSMDAQTHHGVGHVSKAFYDSTRGREIPTEVYYPASTDGDQAPIEGWGHPVIVFGHGFLMEWEAYKNLWEHYVPQGYIMAFPRTETGMSPDHGSFAQDLISVADKLKELNEENGSRFHQRLSHRWALMGHSMGGGAAFLAAASDTSVSSLIAFAPAETDPSAIDTASSIEIPTIVFSGDKDGVTPPPDHHIPMYEASTSSCKFFISILGGAHCYFAEPNDYCDLGEASASSGISISRSEQQELTYRFSDPWMASVLQGDSSAFSDLEGRLSSTSSIGYRRDCQEDPTSLNGPEEERDPKLQIQPNPAQERLNLLLDNNWKIKKLRIHTLQGKLASFEQINPQTLDISELDPGVHFLRVQFENGNLKILRFIKLEG